MAYTLQKAQCDFFRLKRVSDAPLRVSLYALWAKRPTIDVGLYMIVNRKLFMKAYLQYG